MIQIQLYSPKRKWGQIRGAVTVRFLLEREKNTDDLECAAENTEYKRILLLRKSLSTLRKWYQRLNTGRFLTHESFHKSLL